MKDMKIELLSEYKYKPSIAIERAYVGDDKNHWTDGHMLLKRSCINRPIKRMYKNIGRHDTAQRAGKDIIKRILDTWDPYAEEAGIPELVRINSGGYGSRHSNRSTVMMTSTSGRKAVLSADKVKFLLMKVKDCSFYLRDDGGAVQIMSGKERVGMVMPMRC